MNKINDMNNLFAMLSLTISAFCSFAQPGSINPMLLEKQRTQDSISALLDGCNDQSEWLRAQNMHYLAARAKAADFGQEQLRQLYKLLQDTFYHRTPLFPIVGRLNWPEGEQLMEKYFQEGAELLPIDAHRPSGFIASPKWKAAIALARKGHQEATQYLITKAKEQSNQRVIKEIFLQFQLVKTRPVIDYIIEFLFSDGKYSLGPGHLEESDFDMAYAALYDIIEGLWEFHGHVESTREWIKNNRNSYRIINE